MSLLNNSATPVKATTTILLMILLCCAGYLFFYYWHISKNLSGHYQAHCDQPSCSFELVMINDNEYILKYLDNDIKMTRYVKEPGNLNTAYLYGSNYVNLGPPFSGITFDVPDKDYIQWHGRAYYKQ